MDPKFKAGSVLFLPLLLVLSISGFLLVKAVVQKSFADAQNKVSSNYEQRYDPYSARYSLSRQMGAIDTWITFTNERYNYTITHPRVWNKLKSRNFPGAEDLYEAALSSKVKLSVTVQKSFEENKKAPKIKSLEGNFYLFDNSQNSKGAYIKKDDLYYIVRIQENDYFGTESEFLATFGNIVKRVEFLD